MSKHKFDLVQAAEFLRHLDPKAEAFTFQTFDDSKARSAERAAALKKEVAHIQATLPVDQQDGAIASAKRRHRDPYARIVEGTLANVADQLTKLNNQGAGVFVTVNRTRLDKTRKAGSIVDIRGVFADLDGAPLEPLAACPLKPQLTIESSPGRYHAYWFADGLPTAEFRAIQKSIIDRFNSDPAVHDLPRVMRLPGFYHQKEGTPFLTRIHSQSATMLPYTADQVRKEFYSKTVNSETGQDTIPDDSIGNGDIPVGERNGTLLKIAGKLRGKGLSQVDIESTLTAINQARCKPPLEDGEVVEVARRYQQASESTDWPVLRPIPNTLPPVPKFDLDLLPDTIRPWVEDIAARMQCPVDFVAIPAMISAGAIIGSRIAVRPKQVDTWHEVPNLWGMVIGNSGVKKSPALSEALKWLRDLQHEADKAYDQVLSNYALAKTLHEITLAQKKSQSKAGKYTLTLQDLQEPDCPARTRLLVNDTTVEALGIILQDNPNGTLVFADEIVGLLSRLDGEERRTDRTFYLEAYNGMNDFTVDRITRAAVRIPRLCVSVLGSTQPDALRTYLRYAVMGGIGNDGLMQRFQLAVHPDHPIGPIPFVDQAPDTAAAQQAEQTFCRLAQLDPIAVGACLVPNCRIPMLGFNAAAQSIVNQWLNAIDNILLRDLHPALVSHYSKYRKTMPTLALVIHLTEGGAGQISERATLKAIGWINYLREHAKRIYSAVSKAHIDAARTLSKYIKNGKLADGFTLRDIYLNGWTGLSTSEDARMAVEVLVELHWIEGKEEKTGGRPTVRYFINPELTRKAA